MFKYGLFCIFLFVLANFAFDHIKFRHIFYLCFDFQLTPQLVVVLGKEMCRLILYKRTLFNIFLV